MDKYGFELNKIYNLEALTSLKKIPDGSVDLVFFDPPYNANKDYGIYKDNLTPEEYEKFMKNIINECIRISKRGIGVYLDWKHFKMFWHNLIPQAEPIIIYKRSSGFILSPLKIMQHHHVILTTAKALVPIKSVWDDIRVYGEGYLFREETFGHPAQTSLKATKRFIEAFSEKGEIILDPFMGVGTTAVAAKQLGRKFIGFELNPEYIKTANKRLAQNVITDSTLEVFEGV
ncbi:MAG: site-specific DNA-methyltransferase [Thermoplasmata archaeon]